MFRSFLLMVSISTGLLACGGDGGSFHNADKKLSELDDGELAQLCEDIQETLSTPEFNDAMSRALCFGLLQFSGEACVDAELDACVAELMSGLEEGGSAECTLDPASAVTCDATVGALEACTLDTTAALESLAGASCAELSALAGVDEQPESCRALEQACPELFESTEE